MKIFLKFLGISSGFGICSLIFALLWIFSEMDVLEIFSIVSVFYVGTTFLITLKIDQITKGIKDEFRK